MSEQTKACNLTEYEIKGMIKNHCAAIATTIEAEADFSEGIERINYLNKRLKEFKKSDSGNQAAQALGTTAQSGGWGT